MKDQRTEVRVPASFQFLRRIVLSFVDCARDTVYWAFEFPPALYVFNNIRYGYNWCRVKAAQKVAERQGKSLIDQGTKQKPVPEVDESEEEEEKEPGFVDRLKLRWKGRKLLLQSQICKGVLKTGAFKNL